MLFGSGRSGRCRPVAVILVLVVLLWRSDAASTSDRSPRTASLLRIFSFSFFFELGVYGWHSLTIPFDRNSTSFLSILQMRGSCLYRLVIDAL